MKRRSSAVITTTVVLAVLAAGCSQSDDESSSDTTTAAAVETTAAAPVETDAAVDTTAAAADDSVDTTAPAEADAGGVTIGEDGRLVPAECAAGTNTADPDHGVTEDSVNVAIVGIDYVPLAKIGFSATERRSIDDAKVYIDAINEAGGICGRTLDYQGVLYDQLTAKGGEACLQVTGDRTNLIVMGQGGWNEVRCVTQAGTLATSNQDWSKADVGEENGLLFVRGVPIDDQFRATVEYALDNNLLQGKKVGVWYGGVYPNQSKAFEDIGLPLLDEAGIDYKAFRTDYTGPSDPQGSTVLKTAAAEFASMGVEVMMNFAGTTNHTGMQGELAALGLKPVWISAPVSGNSSNELFAKAFNVQDAADGETYITYSHVAGEVTGEEPTAKSCMDQFQAAGGDVVEPGIFDYSAILNMCLQVDLLAAALSVAGPELTQESMIAALESLPASTNARELGEVFWGEGGRFNTHNVGILKYDGASNTSSSTGDLIPLDS